MTSVHNICYTTAELCPAGKVNPWRSWLAARRVAGKFQRTLRPARIAGKHSKKN